MPEVDDFLGAQIFEDFSIPNLALTIQYLTAPLLTRLAAIGDRFIVVSYGQNPGTFTHAIVFDLVLGRYGKLRHKHVQFFQYPLPNLYAGTTYAQLNTVGTTYDQLLEAGTTYAQLNAGEVLVPQQKQTLACLANDGTVNVIDFGVLQQPTSGTAGVFIIGKFQYVRNNWITHQTTVIESVAPGAKFSAYIFPTLDGKTFQPAFPLVPIGSQAGLSITFGGRVSGQNISHLLIGVFQLTTMVLQHSVGGNR
jgi:hypothetical protein